MTKEELDKLQEDEIIKVTHAGGSEILSISEVRACKVPYLEEFVLSNKCEILPRFSAPV